MKSNLRIKSTAAPARTAHEAGARGVTKPFGLPRHCLPSALINSIVRLSLAGPLIAQTSPTVFNTNAAWCWYQDERIIVDGDKLIFGSVADASGPDGATRNGDIEATIYDMSTSAVNVFTLYDGYGADDHNAPAFMVRPDGRILAVYAGHAGTAYFRITTNPHDTSSWSARAGVGMSCTYSNVYRLSSTGLTYDFNRAENYNPNVRVSADDGSSWSYMGRLVNIGTGGSRPYVKYASNGVDKIWFTYTDGHPRDANNNIYVAYMSGTDIYNPYGVDIGDVAPNVGTVPSTTNGTMVYDSPADASNRGWTSDMSLDSSGYPVLAYTTRRTGDDHRFRYARFDGSAWSDQEIAYAGRYLYSAENDYTGLITLNHSDPNTIYIGTDADPASGAPLISASDGLRHWELFRGFTNDNGATWTWTPVTADSNTDHVRPMLPIWDNQHTALVWMRGTYTTYTNWNMSAVGYVFESANGIWSNVGGGTWTDSGNWRSGLVASGKFGIADFSTLDVSGTATVQLNGSRTLGKMVFGDANVATAGNWTLDSGTGGNIILENIGVSSPEITVENQSATIQVPLAGSQGLDVNGTGTLILGATNTYTGPTRVLGGSLKLTNTGAIHSSSSVRIAAGATFDTSAKPSFAPSDSQPLVISLDPAANGGTGAAGMLLADGLNITSATVMLETTGALNDAAYVIATHSPGDLTGTSFASITGLPAGYVIDYAYNGGTQIAVVYSGTPGNQAPVAGSQSVTTSANTQKSITLAATDPDNDPLTYSVVANPAHGALSGSGANLIYTPTTGYSGADSFTFKANDGSLDSNVATVNITVSAPSPGTTLIWDTVTGDGATITAGSGTWDTSTVNWNDGTANTTWPNNKAAVFAGGDGSHAISLAEDFSTTGGGFLQFLANGYTLSAASPQSLSSTYASVSINTPPTPANSVIWVAAGDEATIGGNITVLANTGSYGAKIALGGNGAILNIAAGAALGRTSGNVRETFFTGQGTVNVSGAVTRVGLSGDTGAILVGSESADNVVVNVNNGGVLETNSAGTANAFGSITVGGYEAGSQGTLNVNAGAALHIGVNGASSGIKLTARNEAATNGTINLNGGTITTPRIYTGTNAGSVSTFNFNGGTLKANISNNTNFLTGLTAANVMSGGAMVDTNGYDVTITQNLLHHSGLDAVPDGGLLKSGAGMLTLAGANTYTGPTNLNAGTLLLNGSIASTDALVSTTGTTLSGTGSCASNVTISGTHAPGNLIGTQTFTGTLNYAPTARLKWSLLSDSNSGGAASHIAGGGVNIESGAAVDLVFNGAGGAVDFTTGFWNVARNWQVITATRINGTFTLGSVSVDSNGHAITSHGTFALQQSASSITLTYTPLTPEEVWRQANFGTDWNNNAIAAATADPDNDGINNLLERAFGGNPNAADSNLLPATDSTAPLISITYRKAIAATDLVFTVEENPDINSNAWVPANGTSSVLIDNGTVQTLRFMAPASGAPRKFLRLHVTAP